MDIVTVTEEIKVLLKNISPITEQTTRNDENRVEIGYYENPLNPNLLAYCFDVILGFTVHYRIYEKVNYIIEFDYKGTYAVVGHYKLSYRLSIEKQYKDEIIAMFQDVLPLLEQLFMLIGEKALLENEFSMKNEAPEYFAKLEFYQNRIEKLELKRSVIEEKVYGQYDVFTDEHGYMHKRAKGQAYLRSLRKEIVYDIEAYIDTFYSALEHVLTLLYPFVRDTALNKSYYKNYIRNTKWAWDSKIRDICGDMMPCEITEELRRIKEVYRNHNAHGGFSREMMAYVQIPHFGRYPMYVGKEYLRGFVNGYSDSISYEMYLNAKIVFNRFWETLDIEFEIPMMFVRNGLSIPIDADRYTDGIESVEQAQWVIDKMWYDIDNQSNMAW